MRLAQTVIIQHTEYAKKRKHYYADSYYFEFLRTSNSNVLTTACRKLRIDQNVCKRCRRMWPQFEICRVQRPIKKFSKTKSLRFKHADFEDVVRLGYE